MHALIMNIIRNQDKSPPYKWRQLSPNLGQLASTDENTPQYFFLNLYFVIFFLFGSQIYLSIFLFFDMFSLLFHHRLNLSIIFLHSFVNSECSVCIMINQNKIPYSFYEYDQFNFDLNDQTIIVFVIMIFTEIKSKL